MDNHPDLSEPARQHISDGHNLVFISAAVIWEIRFKQGIGKLQIPPTFLQVLASQPFEFLPVTTEHAYAVGDLPQIHRDPFDRMLIAQAIIESFAIVTRDRLFEQYKVPTIIAQSQSCAPALAANS